MKLYIKLYMSFFSLVISLMLSCPLQAMEDGPSQEEQIKILRQFGDSPTVENYDEVQKIAEKNFKVIGNTIKARFGENSESYNHFLLTKEDAYKSFSHKEMSFRKLIHTYFLLATYLDGKTNTNLKYAYKEIDNMIPFMIPIPVVSPNGISEIPLLFELISHGYCYVGVPLNPLISFDGEVSGPQRFFMHDIFHATFLGDPADNFLKKKTIGFIRKFGEHLLGKATSERDTKIIELILFLSTHEKNQSKIFMILKNESHPSSDEKESFKKFSTRILEETKIDIKYYRRLDLYNEYVEYAEKQHLMTFKENATLPEKVTSFATMLNAKIDKLIHSF